MTRPFVWPLTNSCAGGKKPPVPRPPKLPGDGKGTSRRALLGGTGALLAGTTAAAASDTAQHPDAALLAACVEYKRLEEEYSYIAWLPACDPRVDAGLDALTAHQQPLVDLICTTPALTPEGFAAKVRLLVRMEADKGTTDNPDDYWSNRLTNALARDLEGGVA